MQYKILIPARGGSKRIPKKNIVDLNGKPLILYALGQALALTDEVYVSTDDQDIADICSNAGGKILWRPKEISGDYSTTEEVISHFLDLEETDILVLLQATCPTIKSEDIQAGLDMMDKYDSVISVSEENGFYWDKNGTPINFEIGKRFRTQDIDPWYKENGSFYITKAKLFKKENILYSERVGFVCMENSIDIDNYYDLEIARRLL
jgi:CMP-N-acetylneuraminic acid synthetase